MPNLPPLHPAAHVVNAILTAGPAILGRPIHNVSIELPAPGEPPRVLVILSDVTGPIAGRLFTGFGASVPMLSAPYGAPGREAVALEGYLPDGVILRVVLDARDAGVL